MKIWFILKAILYTVAGALILAFNTAVADNVGLIVGIVILAYGVDLVVISLIKKSYIGGDAIFFGALIHIFIGVILFIVRDDIVKVCLVWAVWSILRESKELSEAIHRLSHRRPAFLNAAESLLIIALSFTMVLEPTVHHAHVHVVILGVELILEIVFPIANKFIDGLIERKKADKAAPPTDGETGK